PLSVEYRLIGRDGSVVWIRDDGVVVLGDDGEPLYLQGYLLDITAEREAQAQLRMQALYDALTGLANRAFFHEQLEHAVLLRKEAGQQSALVYVDLNEFKEINDQHGHTVGDEVLAILGRRLKSLIRAGDSVARIGGDEFAVLLEVVSDPGEAVHARVPAGRVARAARGRRARGAAPLAASRARRGGAAGLHSARGGVRPDRPHRTLGPARGVPVRVAAALVARARPGDRGERIGATAAASRVRRARRRRARIRRAAGAPLDAGADGERARRSGGTGRAAARR